MEKSKVNKKLILIIVIAVLVVAAIAVLVVSLVKPSYKKQIKEFAKACESEEKMEKYVEKYVNLKAIYAMRESEEAADFEDEYKKAKKSDYKDDEFVDEVKETFNYYVSDDTEIKVKEIGKLEKCEEEDMEMFKVADVTFEIKEDDDSEEVDMQALFYKGQIILIGTDDMF